MEQVFRNHRLCKQDGPLGPYIDPYAAEMRGERYSQQTSEKQIRVVVDFGRWLGKRGIQAQGITAELFQPYLRAQRRRRLPTGNEGPALRRLLELLIRTGVVPAPVPPPPTGADQLEGEFRLYLQQERALASTTQDAYLGSSASFSGSVSAWARRAWVCARGRSGHSRWKIWIGKQG